MYKDKEKQKQANRKASKRYRNKGMTPLKIQGASKEIPCTTGGMTDKGMTQDGTSYPDILYKLTDPIWRPRLEKICHAFKNSHHPSYINDVWLGNYNLSQVCELLEVTG